MTFKLLSTSLDFKVPISRVYGKREISRSQVKSWNMKNSKKYKPLLLSKREQAKLQLAGQLYHLSMLSSMIKEVIIIIIRTTKNQIRSVIRAKSSVLTTQSCWLLFRWQGCHSLLGAGGWAGISLVFLEHDHLFHREKMEIKAGNLKSQ